MLQDFCAWPISCGHLLAVYVLLLFFFFFFGKISVIVQIKFVKTEKIKAISVN